MAREGSVAGTTGQTFTRKKKRKRTTIPRDIPKAKNKPKPLPKKKPKKTPPGRRHVTPPKRNRAKPKKKGPSRRWPKKKR
ncbi:hypothetical protein LCGC14_2508480 [marine sediment metagenome]|uniref:Uncharacterized protein n=1 Tax=marine sediment metagenome TaxID=412755 RepID=A0A0F9DTC8_9ZZZZ